jgi:hypothetical protein
MRRKVPISATRRRERSRAGICCPRPWCVHRHGIDDARACVSHSASVLFSHPSTTNSPPGIRSSGERPTCVNVNTVASRLLQCSPRWSTCVHLTPLQRVQNAAARLVLELGPRDHVSAALRKLHWLPIRKRIDYQLCLLAHNVRIGHAPEYVSELLTAT